MNTHYVLNLKAMKIACSIALIASCAYINVLFAQGWENAYEVTQGGAITKDLIQTLDGNYIISGPTTGSINNEFGAVYIKFDDQGNTIWTRVIPAITTEAYVNNLSDSTYITIGSTVVNIPGIGFRERPNVRKLDTDGNTIWDSTYVFLGADFNIDFYKTAALPGGGFVFEGSNNENMSGGNFFRFIGEIDANGQILWQNDLGFNGSLYERRTNGNLILTTVSSDSIYRYETNAMGTVLEVKSVPRLFGTKGFAIHDEEISIVTLTYNIPTNSDTSYVKSIRFDAQQNIVAQDSIMIPQYIDIRNVSKLNDGMAVVGFAGQFWATTDGVDGLFLTVDEDTQFDIVKVYDYLPGTQNLSHAIPSLSNGYIVSGGKEGNPSSLGFGTNQLYVFKTDENGDVYTNIIAGEVKQDQDDDCLISAGDLPVSDWIVLAETVGQDVPFAVTTDDNGQYLLPVDTGAYTIRLIPINEYWGVCVNEIPVTFSDFDNSEVIDFSVDGIVDCPVMSVSVLTPAVRPCFERPVFVEYCNNGSVIAEDAYLEIQFDSLFDIVSSSLPWDSLGTDNLVTWDLGDLDPLECGSFTISVLLDCDAPVGVNYCIESHIYPDSICLPVSSSWSGAFLELTSTCVEDEVYFEIKNVGAEMMQESSSYIIVEDAVLLIIDETNLLESDSSLIIPVTGNGSTYTLLAEQVPDAPGLSVPMTVVEACGENSTGGFSINLGSQFPLDDYNPFVDIDCPVAVNSFDPNDKQASPTGYGEENYILEDTPIEYLIRFQNTGTDTAFTVIIRDTLDPWLDVATFEKGAGSHPYDLELSGRGVLSFTFNNIMLPDSAANQAASNGYITFRIRPRAAIAKGTVIRNDAAIYFDYNPPIITNETFHTIAEDYLEVLVTSTSHPVRSDISVLVRPNPLSNIAVLEVKNHVADTYLLEVFDITGKQVRQERYQRNPISFYRKNLTPGLYFYRLSARDGFLNTGKIIIH